MIRFAAVRRPLKYFVLLVLFALVPLRAYAAVTVGLCATGEGGTVGWQGAAQHHGGATQQPSSEDDTESPVVTCSLCTACCTGASLASEAVRPVPLALADLEPIPFFGRDPDAPHPDELERPPLPL